MKGLLLVGGRGPDRALAQSIREGMDFVIAADSGFDLALRLGITADLVVGDMDSISDPSLLDQLPPGIVITFPRNKDETDTEIGLRMLQERGIREVTILGGGEGRLDHLLGIALLFERDFSPVRWITDKEYIQLLTGDAEFRGWKGQTVSFFPLGIRVSIARSEGLKWPLDGITWKRGEAGLSNLITSDKLCIHIAAGRLLMVRILNEVPRC